MTATHEADPTGRPPCPRRLDPAVLVLPLRLFLGVAWLRVGVANLASPLWRNGDLVQRFAVNQDVVALPFALWILDAAGRHVVLVAWVVGVTEVLCGLALLAGAWLRTALAAAVVMNLVFLVCGQVNPSIFYLMIEVVLLAALLSGAVGARRALTPVAWRVVAIGSAVLAVVLLPFIETLDPEELIFDPGAVLSCLLALCAVGSWALSRPVPAGRVLSSWLTGRWRPR